MRSAVALREVARRETIRARILARILVRILVREFTCQLSR